MPRGTPLIVGLLASAALVAAFVTLGRPGGWRRASRPGPSASASASGSPIASAVPAASGDPATGTGDPLIDPPEVTTDWSGDGGKTLPAGAPGSVAFGVILFSYQGAQLAPNGARPKEEAREKAKAIIEEARKDFAEAAKKGDRGSTGDAGRMPRGVLEPEVETVLFGLEKGTVHGEPIDTPRGFWVVKRID